MQWPTGGEQNKKCAISDCPRELPEFPRPLSPGARGTWGGGRLRRCQAQERGRSLSVFLGAESTAPNAEPGRDAETSGRPLPSICWRFGPPIPPLPAPPPPEEHRVPQTPLPCGLASRQTSSPYISSLQHSRWHLATLTTRGFQENSRDCPPSHGSNLFAPPSPWLWGNTATLGLGGSRPCARGRGGLQLIRSAGGWSGAQRKGTQMVNGQSLLFHPGSPGWPRL
ncbi:hypothetical protein AAFF_G00105940 [Aldrovandia affinis]|uniref:Uncharacterized protein n=1 Tax=Aldrovandia affinis TaxID=143900 RepID=A0AAD7T220_9TELE|nr:hypothetical protein AAFF_G00105940 [Aldrovandia affinis]